MSAAHNPRDKTRERSIAAVATFSALMHHYERGELAAAADAQDELERLGVRVRFVRPTWTRKAVHDGQN